MAMFTADFLWVISAEVLTTLLNFVTIIYEKLADIRDLLLWKLAVVFAVA